MLKLEKRRNSQIHVYLRKREGLFTRSFLYALAIALSLHLLAAVLFHVHALFFSEEHFATTILVEIERPDAITAASASSGNRKLSKHSWMAPMPKDPPIPVLNNTSTQTVTIFPVEEGPIAFVASNEDWDYLINKKCTGKLKPAMQVHISGPLADVAMTQNGVLDPSRCIDASIAHDYLIEFLVRVKRDTGQIFWYSLKDPSIDPDIIRNAVQILKSMRFQPDESHYVTAGEVEILLRL